MSTNTLNPQQRTYREWRDANSERGVQSKIARKMGRAGKQLAMWASGNRSTLPFDVAAALSLATGIPLSNLLTTKQRNVLARVDAARERHG